LTDGGLGRHARACLARAGWTAQRRTDIGPHLRQLEADGYAVSETVREFLARFGGLRLTYPHFRVPQENDSCHFDAAEAARGIFPATVAKWAEGVGEPLCPIGEAFSGHMTLVMTPSGAVYAGFEDTLVHVGDTPVDAINSLCEGREDERRIPLPGFFDDRRNTDTAAGGDASALDALLAQASGPTGPELAGSPDPLLPPDLAALLSVRNGFTAFHGGLRVYRLGGPGEGPELWAWNDPGVWKEAYGGRADNLLCFGRSLLGEQYAFDLVNGGIVMFDPDSGDREGGLGRTLEEWAAWLFEYPFLHSKAVDNWARAYQDAHGPLGPSQCLTPITAFEDGGAYEVDNLTAADMAEALRRQGAAALHRGHHL